MNKARLIFYSIMATLLVVVGLLFAATKSPSLQQRLAKEVAKELSAQWGTHVSIKKAQLNGIISMQIDSLCIDDQNRKPMLSIARVSAKMSPLELIKGKIRIFAANIEQPSFNLYTRQQKANYQFLIDSLSKDDGKEKHAVDLKIAQVRLNNGSLRYQSEQQKPLILHKINGNFSLKELSDTTLRLHTRQLSFASADGFQLHNATFNLNRHNDTLRISNATIELPQSKIDVNATLRDRQFDADMAGHITPADLTAFVQQAKPFNRKLNLRLLANGNIGNNQTINVRQLDIAEPTGQLSLAANGQYAPNHWQANIEQLSVSNAEMQRLSALLRPAVNLPEEVLRLGAVRLNGNIQQNGTALSAMTHLDSEAGQADITLNDNATQQTIDLNTPNLNIGRILQNTELGVVDGQATIQRLHNQQQTNIDATLNSIAFRNYNYTNVRAKGTLHQSFAGNIVVNDPNLQANAILTPDNIQAHIAQANLSKLKLGPSFKEGVYSLDFETNLNKDSHNGYAQISNLLASVDNQEIEQQKLRIDLKNTNGEQTTNIVGDFGQFEITGRYDLANITNTLANIVKVSLPTMPGLPETKQSNNQFKINGTLSDATIIHKILGIPLVVKAPATIHGDVNESNNQLHLDILLPDALYADSHYKQGQITIAANNDKITSIIALQQLHDNGRKSHWHINANAEDNQLKADLDFESDQMKRIKGKIHTESTFRLNAEGLPTAFIQVLPSSLMVEDSLWNVHTAQIVYNKQSASIDNFAISHGPQHIRINGQTAKDSNDSIVVDLNDMDVAYILNLVNFTSVEFAGNATGKVYLSHLFDQIQANAQLCIPQFKFERGHMGDLTLQAWLNNDKKQIDLEGNIIDGPFHQTHIRGFVSPQNNDILLAIDAQQTPTEFLQKICGSFMGNVDMTASGHVDLVGPLNDIGLIGALNINGSFLMKPFGTTYSLKDSRIVFSPYLFTFENDTIYDKKDNKAVLSGTIRHRNLGHLQFGLDADMADFEVYNFQDYRKNTFSGNVFASGKCFIRGTEADMFIDFEATPSKNSTFVYNASSPDAIEETSFITWFDAEKRKQTQNDEPALALPEQGSSTPSFINQNTKDIDISGDLHVNFLINATPDATLKVIMDEQTGDYIDLNGDGILRASYYNNGPFHIYGNYLVDHGVYKLTVQNIIKKDFQFQQGGSITFGGEPYDAPISLQAKYTVNGVSLADLHVGRSFSNNNIRVDCLMNITGTPNAPKIDFGLEFPSLGSDAQKMVNSLINSQEEMNQQVLYLLAVGRFYSQGSNNAESETATQQSQTSLAMQSILSGTISQQINNILNSVVNNGNWNFGANISTGDEGWNNAEYEGTLSGRMLNNRLLFNGQFGYRDNDNATTSFIGDFDLRYLLFPNGNLAINVYNETSDRYFTKNSLNTQGIGLIIKKDFTSWRDLLGLKVKKQKAEAVDSLMPTDTLRNEK